MNGFILAVITTMKRISALALVIACPGALAAEDVWQPKENNAVWQSECGSCHMAFPPALLSKDDWHLLMQGLDKHFGVSASLDSISRDEIDAFFERNGGSSWGHSANSQRITETNWFVVRHKGPIRMLVKGRFKSLADCAACHKGAETAE